MLFFLLLFLGKTRHLLSRKMNGKRKIRIDCKKCPLWLAIFYKIGKKTSYSRRSGKKRTERSNKVGFSFEGAAAYQLGNTSSRTITEVKQR